MKNVMKRTIASSIVNQGSYDWHIPHVIDYPIHYTLKAVNTNNPEVFNDGGRFGILKTTKKLIIQKVKINLIAFR